MLAVKNSTKRLPAAASGANSAGRVADPGTTFVTVPGISAAYPHDLVNDIVLYHT
jgi:hypothetical protein